MKYFSRLSSWYVYNLGPSPRQQLNRDNGPISPHSPSKQHFLPERGLKALRLLGDQINLCLMFVLQPSFSFDTSSFTLCIVWPIKMSIVIPHLLTLELMHIKSPNILYVKCWGAYFQYLGVQPIMRMRHAWYVWPEKLL